MLNKINQLIIVSVFALTLFSCSGQKTYGEVFQPGKVVPISEIDNKGQDYIGKNIQMEGEVTKVCTTMKCWFYMKDSNNKFVYVDLEMNNKFAADISSGDTVIVKGTIKPSQPNSPKLSLFADGIIVK